MAKATTNNKKKSSSSAKKLVPAVGMLAVSAAMLSTATYAWFTMNKDVKVTGLTMSATTSDGLEISLGDVGATNATSLAPVSSNGQITAPSKLDKSWKQSVNIAEYYSNVGELMPASSDTGLSIFYVDTNGVYAGGTDVVDGTTVSQAAWLSKLSSTLTTSWNRTQNAALVLASAYSTTGTLTSSDSITPSEGSSSVDATGYYIDIPMWIRTNATNISNSTDSGTAVNCAVKITDPDETNGSDLINAVRVAILPVGENTTIGASVSAADKDTDNGTSITDGASITLLSNSTVNSDVTSTIFGLTDTTYNDKDSKHYAIKEASTKSGESGGYGSSILGEQTVVKAVGSASTATESGSKKCIALSAQFNI